MYRQTVLVRIVTSCCLAFTLSSPTCPAALRLEIAAPGQTVAQYHKLELNIVTDRQYANPYDPDPNNVWAYLQITTPSHHDLGLPAFYCQEYERRRLEPGQAQANWYYPVGRGVWKARFAPREPGQYRVRAAIRDKHGSQSSNTISFRCEPSSSKGYIRVSREDPRFFAFSEGQPFFAIGQNLAFVGETQYVNLSKAEEIFKRLAQNGANFVRVWTGCEDWALALEAPKSVWQRSWSRNAPIVELPQTDRSGPGRKGIRLTDPDQKSIEVSPSHRVGLRPNTAYRLTGRFLAEDAGGLELQSANDKKVSSTNSGP